MSATAIYASRILTPQDELKDCVIVVEAGRITGIGHRDEVHIPPGAKDYVASGMTVVSVREVREVRGQNIDTPPHLEFI